MSFFGLDVQGEIRPVYGVTLLQDIPFRTAAVVRDEDFAPAASKLDGASYDAILPE